MSPARLAARSLALLGPVAGPVTVHAPARLATALAAGVAPARNGVAPAAAVVAFLGDDAGPEVRGRVLHDLQAVLPCGAPLVVIDHNQPRTLGRRVLGALRLALGGLRPSRARYPVAREVLAAGFAVTRLDLAAGERVQLVLARRR